MALIVYTSGSTGAPKSFCITHTNLIAFVGAVNLPGHRFSDDDDEVIYPSPHVGIHFQVDNDDFRSESGEGAASAQGSFVCSLQALNGYPKA